MSDKPTIQLLIREWHRKFCHPKYDNIDKSVRVAALKELFDIIKANGYSYDDIGDHGLKKIEECCLPKKKEYKYPLDSWERKVRADIRNVSNSVFVPQFFEDLNQEKLVAAEALAEPDKKDDTKSVDKNLLKKDIKIENTYDEEFMNLLGVPEEFRE